MPARYAIYYAPNRTSLLWRLGCAWQGRDPTGHSLAQDGQMDGLDPDRHAQMVRSAAHYGFHATLKAPFSLKSQYTEDALRAELSAFARAWVPFRAPGLVVGRIGGFLALVLAGPSPAFDTLAGDLVRDFDAFRKPETDEEIARRRSIHLTARHEANLVRWGYPYVFEDHQFHMTLTTWLDEPELNCVEARLRALFRPVTAMPLWVDRICLFRQPSRKEPFVRVEDYILGIGPGGPFPAGAQ